MSAVIVITPDELRAIVRDEVRAALEERAAQPPPAEWIDTAAAAELLGVCARTITRLIKREALPAKSVGGVYRYRRADLLAWLERRST